MWPRRNKDKEGWEWGRYWIFVHSSYQPIGFGYQKFPVNYWPDNPDKPSIPCHYRIFYFHWFIVKTRA